MFSETLPRGTLEVFRKQNSLFPLEPVIKHAVIPLTTQIWQKTMKFFFWMQRGTQIYQGNKEVFTLEKKSYCCCVTQSIKLNFTEDSTKQFVQLMNLWPFEFWN